MKIYTLVFGALVACPMQAQTMHDWENHHVLQINREPARAAFTPFSVQKGDCSMSLDGTWKFRWTPVPGERIIDFYQTDFNDKDWIGLYMLAFLLGRWIGTGLMVKFRPQDMLLVYALMNILLCGVVMLWGGMIGLYAMLAISFFMSIMYPTQFSLALKGLGNQTKSGSAFLVMAIVGNACLPQLTAYFMHVNEHIYYVAYGIPMICFAFCVYYGWKGYKVID